MSDKYENILKLEQKLAASEIPRIFREAFDGYQIIYIDKAGKRIGDVVEHEFSYGLEAMGFGLGKDVQGHLTVKQAFDLFRKAAGNVKGGAK